MSQNSVLELWNECYGAKEKVFDYAGRLMLKCACGDPHSAYQPTVDHIRPIAGGGKDIKANMIICHRSTNEEKADRFPHWKANGSRFHAKKAKGVKNGYRIVNEERQA